MKKVFNISADCKPTLHYMVNIENKLAEIKVMVDRGDYFTINRARQYGKTTILKALGRYLERDYLVLNLDFQKLSHQDFETEKYFVEALSREILKKPFIREHTSSEIIDGLERFRRGTTDIVRLADLFIYFSEWCQISAKPIVFIVDEVDSATNNQVFLDFLAQMRGYYIDRDEIPFFQSVILAGVYDVKNLKRKFVTEASHKTNSPWNMREDNESNECLHSFDDCPRDHRMPAFYGLTADFLVDLSFSPADIAGMLEVYEHDHHTGMDTDQIAHLIYDYTSGYPFLVSYICKLVDERIVPRKPVSDTCTWTKDDILEAVRILLSESNTLFESLINKLEDFPELDTMLRDLLFLGKEIPYVIGLSFIEIALMFGFVKKYNHTIIIANRIFETLLYNLFLAVPSMQQNKLYDEALKDKNQFIRDGHLDMRLILEKFVTHFDDLYGDKQQSFLEEDGRRYFLLYLRPIINGTGNYYIESRTRNMERTDVIVDYRGEQFVIELKLWRGNTYHERGEKQLLDYLEHYHLQKGYMLSFNFNQKKQIGVREFTLGDKTLVEAIV